MCQKSHNTLLHIGDTTSTSADNSSASPASIQVPTHTAIKLKSRALLMTCCVLVTAPKQWSRKMKNIGGGGGGANV